MVGNGTQTRDFTFVTDAVDAFVVAAQSNLTGDIMNIGSDATCSVNRLVELLGGDVVFLPKRPGEPDCTFADTRRIKRQISLVGDSFRLKRASRLCWTISSIGGKRPLEPHSIASATDSWFKYLSVET